MNAQYHTKISTEPIDCSSVFNLVRNASAGAISTFFGVTRKDDDDTNNKHGGVKALNYECYVKMAYAELEKIIQNSYKIWPSLIHVVVFHRHGLVPVGEISVAIAISSPHRKDSLEAVKFLIDSIKSHVPIWKKEIYEDGTSKWKRNRECFWQSEENKLGFINDYEIKSAK
uniref:MOCS2B n=1 Tax=Trichobilharzia regenti TaxID=157069 RepID=A0AA85JKK7_TRIRE|nr:unnamed protein product [Trichobilharzia regenti]